MPVLYYAKIHYPDEDLHKESVVDPSAPSPFVVQRPERGVDKCHSFSEQQFQQQGIERNRTAQFREMNDCRSARRADSLGGSHAHQGRRKIKALFRKGGKEELMPF